MKAIVETEILDGSILGKKIRVDGSDLNNSISLIAYIAATTGVFGTVDIDGGYIDNVIIGSTTPCTSINATLYKASSAFEIWSGAVKRAMHGVGYTNLYDSVGTLGIHLSTNDTSYYNPSGLYGFVFGGTVATSPSGSKYEFKKSTAFTAQVNFDSTVIIKSGSTYHTAGTLLDKVFNFFTNGTATSWTAFENMSNMTTQSGQNLWDMNGATIGSAEWTIVSHLNQSVNSAETPHFAGMVLDTGDLVATAGDLISSAGNLISSTGNIEALGGAVVSLAVQTDTVNYSSSDPTNNLTETTKSWTEVLGNNVGTLYSISKRQSPKYALGGNGFTETDISNYDLFLTIKKTGVSGPSVALIDFSDLFDGVASSQDQLFSFNLYGRIKIGAFLYKYRLECMWHKIVGSTKAVYFVTDYAGAASYPARTEDVGGYYVIGSYFGSSLPVHPFIFKIEGYTPSPVLSIDTTGAGATAYDIYISGNVNLINT